MRTRLGRLIVYTALAGAVLASPAAPAGAQESTDCPRGGIKPRISSVSFSPARVPVTATGDIPYQQVELRYTVSRGWTESTPTVAILDLLGRPVAFGSLSERGGTGHSCGRYERTLSTLHPFPERNPYDIFLLGKIGGGLRPNSTYLLVMWADWFTPNPRPFDNYVIAHKVFRTGARVA